MQWSFSWPRRWGGSQLCCTLTSQGSLRSIRTPSPGPTQRLDQCPQGPASIFPKSVQPCLDQGVDCGAGLPPTLWTPGEPMWGESPAPPGRELSAALSACCPCLPVVLPHSGKPGGQPGLYLPEQSSLRALTVGTPAGSSCPLCTGTALSLLSSTTFIPARVTVGTVLRLLPLSTGTGPAGPPPCLSLPKTLAGGKETCLHVRLWEHLC